MGRRLVGGESATMSWAAQQKYFQLLHGHLATTSAAVRKPSSDSHLIGTGPFTCLAKLNGKANRIVLATYSWRVVFLLFHQGSTLFRLFLLALMVCVNDVYILSASCHDSLSGVLVSQSSFRLSCFGL